MPKTQDELTRHTIYLTKGSYEELQSMYGDSFGAAGAIRLLINSHIKKMQQAADRVPRDMIEEDIKI